MWRQIIWQRSPGYWLFYWSAIYFTVAMLDFFVFKVELSPWIQIIWLSIIALPLTYNPLARWLNMKENHMFDWFKKDKLPANVVPFPEQKNKEKYPSPYVEPIPMPTPPKEAKTYYTIGVTDDPTRMSFTCGHTTLTMTALGAQQLIDQLTVFKDQLHPIEDEHDD